ncbi:hypothetical protein HGRIS_013245 [Hohenbuehelia grisea]|uniref:Uncharacterized protein n=1 Tax=Hohenbuehelia grisea TaxID=104357 RepID=A0ABR3IV33_9AGAR
MTERAENTLTLAFLVSLTTYSRHNHCNDEMLRRSGLSLKQLSRARGLHTSTTPRSLGHAAGRAAPGIVLAGAAAAAVVWNSSSNPIHNDGPADLAGMNSGAQTALTKGKDVRSSEARDPDTLATFVWGSNSSHLLDPTPADEDPIRTPAVARWLDNVALRDLVLHKKHAACIDARGDVYQWGEGFSRTHHGKPTQTLRGKNIEQLQLTENRVYALSASGHVYALEASASKQELSAGAPTPASAPWWSTGWMWGEEESVDFVQITPNSDFGWGEKFVSISAGDEHLLALTSKGRVFAHPVSFKANSHGQLGLRKVDIPDHSLPGKLGTRQTIELIPKSVKDPYARASPFVRGQPDASAPPIDDLSGVRDDTIRFCDRLLEIPSLKGVDIAQIAAGGRSSFVRTTSGRVLGWGANDYGQIGLGHEVVIDTVTVPTEIILWRRLPGRTRSKCLNVCAGGDLTCFAVERQDPDDESNTTVDLLMCGNGQWGGLGNNIYSNAQASPLRARNVSGLRECE